MSATRTLIRAAVDLDLGGAAGRRGLRLGRDAELGVVAAGRAPASRRRRRSPPAARSGRRSGASRAYLSSPSAFIASCTAGRAAIRRHEGAEVLAARDVDADVLGPVGDGEEVGVGDAERVAHQVALAFELGSTHLSDRPASPCASASWLPRARPALNSGPIALVELAGDEVEPLLQAVARHRAVGGRELLGRHLVGDVLDDRRALR